MESSCPSFLELEEALGSGAPAASVLAHLETCSTCREAATGIREDIEFIDGLGQAERKQLAAAFDAGMQNATVAHDRLPGYDVLGEIHRGGQGVVYKAVQHGTQRTVAIKVMHEGPFAGPRDKARFEREVRLLAQLDHPNIVTILESGTAAGSFFHVMDYVAGRSLADHIDAETVPVNQALALFAEICDGVNAAHVLHITHRDLKPANIQIDNDGRPRILDFGLAKRDVATEGEGAPSQHVTATGQFVGTFPWAAPEHAVGAPDKIDARTDAYALGVILYQMLTRRFPYDVTGQPRDVLHNIQTATPTRPSKHRPDIDNEVETIVLECLAKDPDRRYPSAGALARDIRHYLADEPIDAKRDSTWYVLRKTIRRHRVAAGVALGFLVALSSFSVTVSVLYRRAVVAEQRGQESLRQAWLDEARARRLGGRLGRRIESLRALANAAEIRPGSDLRNEAIAAMALADVSEDVAVDTSADYADFIDAQLEWYATSDNDGGIRVRRLSDKQELLHLPPRQGLPVVMQFSLNRRFLGVKYDPRPGSGAKREVCIWDLNRRAVVVTAQPTAHMGAPGFSSDSKQVAIGQSDERIHLYRTSNGEFTSVLDCPVPPNVIRFDPSGRQLAVGGTRQKEVVIYDLNNR